MATSPAISVIWSTYNQSSLFEFTLRSLEAQEVEGGFEVIVCDDGSLARERECNLALLDASPLDARYIWQPDQGFRLARSRNNGIRCARGQLLVFIDGDIVAPTSFLHAHSRRHARTTSPTLIAGPRRWVDLRNASVDSKDSNAIFEAAARHGYYVDKQDQLDAVQSSSPWLACRGFNFSVKRTSEIQYDEQYEGWGKEDFDLACTLHTRFGYSFVVEPDTEVVHLVTEGFSTTNPWITADSCDIAAYVRNCVRFKRKHEGVDVTPALWPLLHFQLDDDRWRRTDPDTKMSLLEAIQIAEDWCDHEDAQA